MRFVLLALVALAAAAGVACGSSDDNTSAPSVNLSPAPEPSGVAVIQMTGQGFADGGTIPIAATCDGTGKSPTILWHEIPRESKSIVVLVTDPDAGNFVHWVVYDIPPAEPGLTAGIGTEATLADGAHQGINSFVASGYGAPCPPKGKTHRYDFHVYALDKQLGLPPGATVDQVTASMSAHVLALGKLTASYTRAQPS